MIQKICYWLSVWFGSGLLKPAPGTWGTLASLPFWIILLNILSPQSFAFVVILSIPFSYFTIKAALPLFTSEDPKEIVLDEVVGMGIAMLFAVNSYIDIAILFILFRLLDITKPWPIGWVDERIKGAWGILLDDVLAGILAIFCFIAVKVVFYP